MTTQLWLLLASAAITVVFTRGSIFQWFRGPFQRAPQTESRVVRLFRDWAGCPLCAGVWFGWAVSLAHDHAGSWDLARAVGFLGFGCVSAVLSLLLYSLLDWLQAPHWEVPVGYAQPVAAPQIVAPPPMPDVPPPVTAAELERRAAESQAKAAAVAWGPAKAEVPNKSVIPGATVPRAPFVVTPPRK